MLLNMILLWFAATFASVNGLCCQEHHECPCSHPVCSYNNECVTCDDICALGCHNGIDGTCGSCTSDSYWGCYQSSWQCDYYGEYETCNEWEDIESEIETGITHWQHEDEEWAVEFIHPGVFFGVVLAALVVLLGVGFGCSKTIQYNVPGAVVAQTGSYKEAQCGCDCMACCCPCVTAGDIWEKAFGKSYCSGCVAYLILNGVRYGATYYVYRYLFLILPLSLCLSNAMDEEGMDEDAATVECVFWAVVLFIPLIILMVVSMIVCPLPVVFYSVWWTGPLRAQRGIPGSYFADCCLHTYCGCCQMTREMREARAIQEEREVELKVQAQPIQYVQPAVQMVPMQGGYAQQPQYVQQTVQVAAAAAQQQQQFAYVPQPQ